MTTPAPVQKNLSFGTFWSGKHFFTANIYGIVFSTLPHGPVPVESNRIDVTGVKKE
ncbi:MAG: hypothetical protein M3342_17630 [Bacteroidota bacterium]|nr:hypothetical protein [Bacteroidota bacterium]